MLILWILVIPIALFIYVVAYHIDRDEARAQADEFIAGTRKSTPKDIDKCVRKLQTANSRLLDRNETDRRRVEILRGLRDNTVTSHP